MLFVLILSFLCVGSFGFVPIPPFPDQRIVGGIPTTIAQHPHQASLQYYGSHYCGASIISNKWVISAGHCAGGSASSYGISVGSNLKKGGLVYDVKRVVRNPQYNGYTIDYDIALFEINDTIKFNKNVSTIELSSVEIPANATVNVTGWGALTEGGLSPEILQQVSVPIVSRQACVAAYADLNTITPRMICAGLDRGGKDSCQGDSGGPLTANKKLYGIVSWGYGCAKPKYPGVYSNVASMRSWIKNVTGI
ncbi:trypsin-2-like [Venturia canescens]|uniref:trypsin-2-like n=1 Tax=Venturia canescens TaxID=32260 RepID=UPI001C9BF00D|nr:trypsin-2-like [Venturia canescens]